MTESRLMAACLKMLRAELPGAVIFKHADARSSGVPDVSITWRGKTIWIEFKFGSTIKWANGLQQLTCRRLAHAGACWVVLYKEHGNAIRQTYILTPDEQEMEYCIGFSHRFVVDFVKGQHAA